MDARFVRAIRAELRDRRGTVLGALTLAGLLAVGAPVVLALTGALAVFGLRLVLAVVPAVRRSPRRTDEWSVRAEIAVRSLRQLSRRAKPGPVAERCPDPLAEHLIRHDRAGDGGVEAVGLAEHGNLHPDVAGRGVIGGQASPLSFVCHRTALRSEAKAAPQREWCVYSESVIS